MLQLRRRTSQTRSNDVRQPIPTGFADTSRQCPVRDGTHRGSAPARPAAHGQLSVRARRGPDRARPAADRARVCRHRRSRRPRPDRAHRPLPGDRPDRPLRRVHRGQDRPQARPVDRDGGLRGGRHGTVVPRLAPVDHHQPSAARRLRSSDHDLLHDAHRRLLVGAATVEVPRAADTRRLDLRHRVPRARRRVGCRGMAGTLLALRRPAAARDPHGSTDLAAHAATGQARRCIGTSSRCRGGSCSRPAW